MAFISTAIAAAATIAAGVISGATFTAIAVSTALTVGAALIGHLTAPKQQKPPGGVEFDVELGGDVFRSIPFGRVARAGHMVYFNTFPATKNKTLQLVYVLADWQCEALQSIWVDGEEKTLNSITAADGADATYEVDGYGTGSSAKFKIWWHAGASGQAVNTRLSGNDNPTGRWDATDTLDGMCYVMVELEWDDEQFPGGRPEMLFVFDGALLYDPRLDTTAGGSGSHRWADPTTWEFSANPAVGLYNFQRGFYRGTERILGMGIPAARLLYDDYTAAMNVCDESLTEGGVSVDRYTCAVIVSEANEHRQAIDAFLTAMAGRHAEQAGYHRIVPGAAQSSVATITQDDLLEGRPMVWSAHRGRDALVNAVFGTYTSPDNGWQPVGYEPVTSSTWETEDGGERIVRPLDLPPVTTPFQANRIAVLKANEHRYEAHGRITVGIKFLAVSALDWITYTNDQGGERFYRVGRRRLNTADMTMDLEIEEVHADAYGGAVVVTTPTVTPPADFAPITEPGSFAVTALEIDGSDGQVLPGLRFSWDFPDDPTIDQVLIQYRATGMVTGAEMVTNGGFDTDTDWTKQSGWTIASGIATRTAAGSFTAVSQAMTLVEGQSYEVTFEVVSVTAGSVRPLFGGGSFVVGTSRSSPGTYTETLVAGAGNTTAGVQGNGTFEGDIDNVSIKEASYLKAADSSPEDGVFTVIEGILATTSYEARATIVTTPRRATTWTDWTPVTSTANITMDIALAEGSVDTAELAIEAVSEIIYSEGSGVTVTAADPGPKTENSITVSADADGNVLFWYQLNVSSAEDHQVAIKLSRTGLDLLDQTFDLPEQNASSGWIPVVDSGSPGGSTTYDFTIERTSGFGTVSAAFQTSMLSESLKR